ncbi:MAG: hypothetical protein RBR96_04090 [Candidatus Izemoplasmatales bacterium]|nr:hypothetical protein [Candidatus Izemoplasmatales bacterium]
MEINITKLDIRNMVFTMGEEREATNQKLSDFLKENNVTAQRNFIFDLVIKQGGKVNTLHLSYAAINEEVKGKDKVQALVLKNNDFLHFVVPKAEYESFLMGDDFKSITQYMKDNKLKNDFTSLYGLAEIMDDGYHFYIPFRK